MALIKNNIFKQEFLTVGDWNFNSVCNFPKVEYLSADTETKLYLNGELLTEKESYELLRVNGQKWAKEHIETKAYAYMLSDGANFALFTCAEDFLLCCAMLRVERVYWYNAKFDFALFDYFFATNGWVSSEQEIGENTKRHKLKGKTYQSLNGDYGQRYQMRIWQEYTNASFHKKVHNFKMLDICNIFGGGLRKNLDAWDIVDDTGEQVRKLHMDYVNASIENDLQYMINDTKGLHLLAKKIDEKIKELSGFSLFKGEYMTAGGLAKKSLLDFTFKKHNTRYNMWYFHKLFPMTIEQDEEFRRYDLYQGGKCFVSPYKVGKVVHNMYRYDINSMYPSRMHDCEFPCFEGKHVDEIKKQKGKVFVVLIENIRGTLKKNMIPVWYDGITREYVDTINEHNKRYMWLEELEEYENWYDLEYDIVDIIEYESHYVKGFKEYVDNYYKIKKESKGVMRNGAKLFLNSAYGKLAERVDKVDCQYEMADGGYMHLVKKREYKEEKGIMSVLVGSRVTAMSRVLLMFYIRDICRGNPKKYFVYCDTDSVHALLPYDKCDSKKLGMMKCEGCFESALYLAPKTYVDYNEVNTDYKDDERRFEVHCKGVNTEVVARELDKCKTFDEMTKVFVAGKTFKSLASLNVKGGKALIYIDKVLLSKEKEMVALDDDERID